MDVLYTTTHRQKIVIEMQGQKTKYFLAREQDGNLESIQNHLVKLALSDENIKKDYENLQTIPGIASISVIAIIAEVPDIDFYLIPELLLHMQNLIPVIFRRRWH